ncbi:MAG: hypothetical protein RLZZ436_124 [Planctomycetota bacterium]|jgi:hypothetical protein
MPPDDSPNQRWAILRHDHPWLHWDLLLERPDAPAATTWRLLRVPCCNEPIAAQALPDHRTVYFDYEGPVSGGRGSVERLARGTWCEQSPESTPAALAGQRLLYAVRFFGTVHFSAGLLTSTPDGRLFWTFTTIPPDVRYESHSPLVPPKNS